MDTKSIAAVLLKVTGLVLIALCVIQLPAYFPVRLQGQDWSYPELLMVAAVTMGPTFVLGVFLWLFPGTIANKIVSGTADEEPPVPYRDIHVIAVTVLGLYLIARGMTDLVYNVAAIVQIARANSDFPPLPASIISSLAATGMGILLGALLCIGASGTVRLIERMRG